MELKTLYQLIKESENYEHFKKKLADEIKLPEEMKERSDYAEYVINKKLNH